MRFDDYETCYRTGAARLYSSGTTGLPKAAELSHLNLIAQHMLVYETNPKPYEVRRFLALPMFHAATAPSAFCTPLRNGDAAYVVPRFNLEQWFWAHEHYQITDLAAVPPIVVQVINSPLAKKYSLKSCKTGQCGAAPLDKGPQARLQALMADNAPVTQVHSSPTPLLTNLMLTLHRSGVCPSVPSHKVPELTLLRHDRNKLHRDTNPLSK